MHYEQTDNLRGCYKMLRDIFSLAFIQVKKRPLRAILTVLQVTLGIATIAVIFNIVFGLWDGIKATEENMGGNVYMLQVGQQSTSSDGRSTHTYMRVIPLLLSLYRSYRKGLIQLSMSLPWTMATID